jgi:hypothetical protein
MARDAYKSEKRRKELERQKKQAEKREKRLKKNEERSEAEVLADLFGMPYEAKAEAGQAGGENSEAAEGPGTGEPPPQQPPDSSDPANPAKG